MITCFFEMHTFFQGKTEASKRRNIAFQGAIRVEKGSKRFFKCPIAFLRTYCPLYRCLSLLRVLRTRRQPVPFPVAAVFPVVPSTGFTAVRLRTENPFPIPQVGQAWLGGTAQLLGFTEHRAKQGNFGPSNGSKPLMSSCQK